MIGDDPAADNTDLYAFVSPDDPTTVTVIANYIPFEDPAGGPNFTTASTPTVLYEIHIDNNGDARDDVTYQFRFKYAGRQPEHVPLQHEPDHVADRSRPERAARRTASGAIAGQQLFGAGHQPARRSCEHRAAFESDVRHRHGRQQPVARARKIFAGRATTRSSSTSGRSSTSEGCGRSTRSTRSRSRPRPVLTVCVTTTRTRSRSRCRRQTC